jgi:regulator of cell morphogenesis and NO signaling
MTTITAQTTVGEIASENPASFRVFEKHGIDFCCGGKIGFADACSTRGLDPEAVLAEIAALALPDDEDATDWRSAPIPALIDHILERHHAYMKMQLPEIEDLLSRVMAAHGAAVPPIARVFGPMKAELDGHLMKEERILFPLIRALEEGTAPNGFHCGGVQNPIRVMLAEHDSAGEALAELREMTGNYTAPQHACNTWRALYFELAELERDLHRHIHLENNILFPRVLDRV